MTPAGSHEVHVLCSSGFLLAVSVAVHEQVGVQEVGEFSALTEHDGAVWQPEHVHRNAQNGRKGWEEKEIPGMCVRVCVPQFISSAATLTLTDSQRCKLQGGIPAHPSQS